ncbi:DedA family protein [Clostridium botulinum]|uniref:DedA family protein n=1 Tax=Clostridium botulinum TaxID=1491 RepID=A0A6B4JJR4_CLOBO|nr:DedA family protein [Clostridium botulinum]EES48182.1 membrane protein, DedA family [Clostridium botulinum E1 str. 'BoNT E Beluga']MBY6760281.1 DedA family protein [Clostridium botulinum]MBY6919188.1 DedA family protein [Clostridium botulinum]MCR1130065.1 DedA family protein [Clostridium botulinum]NFJ57170.1 DedA family protein [Clostridium botulinum]
MENASQIVDVFIHMNKYIGMIINNYGMQTYLILFIVIFCETGLVVTPFLPGDSLIFAAATFAAMGALNIYILVILLIFAAVLGDTVNYEIGRLFGNKLIKSNIVKKDHIEKTNKFYEKHGVKTIMFARFIPIVRTIAPFVAGIGKMNYKDFILFNVIGGNLWVMILSICGYFFGNIRFVRNNLSLILIGMIIISILPAVIVFINEKRKNSSVQKV